MNTPGGNTVSAAEHTIALMTAQPSLIRRPVLEQGDKLLVGFKPAAYDEALG